MVRYAIDGILMQITKTQTEMGKKRSSQPKFSKYFDDLTYLETQICQVSQYMMKLLKAPEQKTVQVKPRQNLIDISERESVIENLFCKYARDKYLSNNEEESKLDKGNLTYGDLLEFLKRCVFKAATCISAFN